MIKLRSGAFVNYKGLQCKLISSNPFKISSLDKRCLELGFEQYPNKQVYFKYIERNEVLSAFHLITKAKYQGDVYQLTENRVVSNEDKVTLFLDNLDFAAYDKFGFNYRDDNANISVKVSLLEEIWEEREPLLNFSFEVDQIQYLKKSN
ncbi:hypothetical protein OKW21_005732 [Catalinimonas alkaloidigena]|uniref:hypothetical protein n=1 Tax=Catalinimonas alkaloidigena TaxID=1075417 RepID=UPI0024073AB4|nr:hypothetical protein [Catalinimonas alkaloidigena]MDF9800469.1 hypothetical protein [Catalinimonas alkaloidigena]